MLNDGLLGIWWHDELWIWNFRNNLLDSDIGGLNSIRCLALEADSEKALVEWKVYE